MTALALSAPTTARANSPAWVAFEVSGDTLTLTLGDLGASDLSLERALRPGGARDPVARETWDAPFPEQSLPEGGPAVPAGARVDLPLAPWEGLPDGAYVEVLTVTLTLDGAAHPTVARDLRFWQVTDGVAREVDAATWSDARHTPVRARSSETGALAWGWEGAVRVDAPPARGIAPPPEREALAPRRADATDESGEE